MHTAPVRRTVRPATALLIGAALSVVLGACQTTQATTQAPPSPAMPEQPATQTASQTARAFDPHGKDATLSESVAALQEEQDYFAYQAAEITVLEGLRGITQRYINPVDMDQLALGGLKGLATIDPALGLDLDADKREIVLRHDQDLLTRLPAPDGADAAGWADITARVIRAGRARSKDLKSADNERVYEALFDGMLANLDVFSRYAGAKEAQANRARRDGFGGIGIRFTRAGDGILITHVMGDSPAMAAGLKPGDALEEVNGTPAQGRKLRDVAEMLRGPVGSLITVSVSRLSSERGAPDRRIDFNLKRSHIVPETVRARVDDGLLLINIASFNKNTSASVHDTLRANDAALRDGKIRGVVLDLRGNPGGLLSQSVNVADLFLSEGRIIATRGRHPDSHHEYTAGGVDLARGAPMVVLVDGESASAAEIVASALQDTGRAVVVGSTSYGKGTVQTVLRLPNDGEMTLTWSRFVSPSGYAIHGLGVMPAVCATDTPPQTVLNTETLTQTILAPEHIDGARDTMDAWRAAGQIFDGRRPSLRRACPARAFKAGEDGDLLMTLARRVLDDSALYQRAVFLSQPLSTASREP